MLPGMLSNHKRFGGLPAVNCTASVLTRRQEFSLPVASLLRIMQFHLEKENQQKMKYKQQTYSHISGL